MQAWQACLKLLADSHKPTVRSPHPDPQVASFMRAVLRTLAQCHSHRILHRDIKVRRRTLLAVHAQLSGSAAAAKPDCNLTTAADRSALNTTRFCEH